MASVDPALNMPSRDSVAPPSREERERCLDVARRYVESERLVPPLSIEELKSHAEAVVRKDGLDYSYRDFLMVLVGNEVWRETVAAVPYDRRVLLLPQCLRSSHACPAELDEFGLLCEECGRCMIGELQSLGESLGYVVLVAEGSTVVTKLLERGRVDAVIGVSCLAALERSFPHAAAHAIPGMAVPLFVDGCSDTKMDADWVREAITLTSDSGWSTRLDLDQLREEVGAWFSLESLREVLESGNTSTEEIGLEWMAKGGKRWRPFLVAAIYRAMANKECPIPESLKKLAIAVECFHKASLIHDDIEDNDDFRYDDVTLHRAHGVPIALNIGDLLIGQGYALCANCGLSAEQTMRVVSVAADAHRKLCLGQGEELCRIDGDIPIPPEIVIEIFRLKTAPAFNVALQFGAIAAGCDDELCEILDTYSDALGTAYQIRDDIEDVLEEESDGNSRELRPSLLLALAHKHGDDSTRRGIRSAWRDSSKRDVSNEALLGYLRDTNSVEKAELLLEHHKNKAVRALNSLRDAQLKTLLRRIVSRILGGV